MNTLAASLTAWALAFAGMAALSLAMDRHHAQVFGRREVPAGPRRALRLLGWSLLALSIWPCWQAWGPSVGLVAWCGWLTAGAGAVAALLPYMPRSMAGAAVLAAAVAAPLLFF